MNDKLTIRWHWREFGFASGVPVLFLHGFMGSGGDWGLIARKFGNKISGIAPDLPGHGETSTDLSRLTFDSFADGLKNFVEGQFARKPLCIGYSLGGRVALYTACRHPNLFSGLLLESANPGIEDPIERAKRLELDRERAGVLSSEDGLEKLLRTWYAKPPFTSLATRPDLVETLVEEKRAANDPKSLSEVLITLSVGVQTPLWDLLPSLALPVVFVTGERDEAYTELATKAKAIMPNAELIVVPDAGHIVHLENFSDFTAALIKLISDVY